MIIEAYMKNDRKLRKVSVELEHGQIIFPSSSGTIKRIFVKNIEDTSIGFEKVRFLLFFKREMEYLKIKVSAKETIVFLFKNALDWCAFDKWIKTAKETAEHVEREWEKRQQKKKEYEKAIKNFEIENTTILRYKGSDSRVVIPNGITKIGEKAFFDNQYIREVVLPDSLTIIEEKAFMRCEKLLSINIPKYVYKIGWKAFWGCEELRHVKIYCNKNVDVGKEVFDWCGELKEIWVDDEELALNNIELLNTHTRLMCIRTKEQIIPWSIWAKSRFNELF